MQFHYFPYANVCYGNGALLFLLQQWNSTSSFILTDIHYVMLKELSYINIFALSLKKYSSITEFL